MNKKLGALASAGALVAAIVSACSSETGGLPKPDSRAKEWCFADGWIDRASYDYAYWAGDNIPGPDEAKKAMSYGSRLTSQYKDDKESGQLPSDLDDKALTAWVVNLATVQEHTPVNAEAGADKDIMDSYIADVHAACN
ncbi:hypothetical protein ABZS86_33820 [Streptomyces sp. NPDC005355]|uniref:hypothetical protein n=1 Tax=Streptomyces sp. NPDC005355 TaxID=3157038 RepID=UPI0033A7D4CA